MPDWYLDPETGERFKADDVDWDSFEDTGQVIEEEPTFIPQEVEPQQDLPWYQDVALAAKPYLDWLPDEAMGFGLKAATGTGRAVGGLAQQAADYIQSPEQQTNPFSFGIPKVLDDYGAGEALEEWGQKQTNYANMVDQKIAERLNFSGPLDPSSILVNLGSVAPMAVAALAAPGMLPFFATMAAQTYGARYGDIRQRGATPGAATAAATASTAQNLALDYLNLGPAFDPVASLGKKLGWSVLNNLWQNPTGEAVDVGIDRLATGKWDEDILGRLGQSFAAAAPSAALTTTGIHYGIKSKKGQGIITDPNEVIDPETDPILLRMQSELAEIQKAQDEADIRADGEPGELLKTEPTYQTLIPEQPKPVQPELKLTPKPKKKAPPVPTEPDIDLVKQAATKTMPDIKKQTTVRASEPEVKGDWETTEGPAGMKLYEPENMADSNADLTAMIGRTKGGLPVYRGKDLDDGYGYAMLPNKKLFAVAENPKQLADNPPPVDQGDQGLSSEFSSPKKPEGEHVNLVAYVEKLPVSRVKLTKVGFIPELMQFKDHKGDKERGTNRRDYVEEKWSDAKGGNTLLWEPKNPKNISVDFPDPNDPTGKTMVKKNWSLKKGQQYVVANGHNRTAGAKDQNVEDYNTQIIREVDGWTAEDAFNLAAEINISEGNGTLLEKSTYLRRQKGIHGKDAAKIRAKQLGKKAGQAATIALNAEDNLWHAFANGIIRADQAEAIAKVAPDDADAQQIGVTFAMNRRATEDELDSLIRAYYVKRDSLPPAQQLNMFDNDAYQIQVEEWSKTALEGQRQLSEEIKSMANAAKMPELAEEASGGRIQVTDAEGIVGDINRLKLERRRWKKWDQHPDVRAQITGEAPSPVLERARSERGIAFLPRGLERLAETIQRMLNPKGYNEMYGILKGARAKSEGFFDPSVPAVGKARIPYFRDINGLLSAFRQKWIMMQTVSDKFPNAKPTFETGRAQEQYIHSRVSNNFDLVDPYYALSPEKRRPVMMALIATRLSAQNGIRPVEDAAFFQRLGLDRDQVEGFQAYRNAMNRMMLQLKKPGMAMLQQNLKQKQPDFLDDAKKVFAGVKKQVNEVEKRNFKDGDLIALGLNAKQRAIALNTQKSADPGDYITNEMYQNHRVGYWRSGVKRLDEFINRNIEERYVPFSRFGDHFISVTDTETGKNEWYSFHEKGLGGLKAQKRIGDIEKYLRQKFPDSKRYVIESEKVTQPDDELFSLLPFNFVGQLGDIDLAAQQAFGRALPRKGFSKHLIKAKLVPGFSADIDRATAEYIIGHAHYTARHEFAPHWEKALNQIDWHTDENGRYGGTEPKLWKLATKWRRDVESYKESGADVRKFIALYYLAGNIKSGVVNLTQPLTTTWPVLADLLKQGEASIQGFSPVKRAARRFKVEKDGAIIWANSYKKAFDWFFRRGTLDPELQAGIRAAIQNGNIDEAAYRNLAGIARGQDRGGGALTLKMPSGKRRPVADLLMFTFAGPEHLNRIHAYICGYDVATRLGLEGADRFKYATELVNRTQYIYSKVNRPEIVRGGAAPLFIFKTWAGNTVRFLRNHATADEFPVIIKSLAAFSGILGGLMALPGWKFLEKALEQSGVDMKKEERELLGQVGVEKEGADAALYGPMSLLTGASLSGPLSMIDLPPMDEGVESALMQFMLGAVGNVAIQRPGKALWHLSKGQGYRAVESILPEAARNVAVTGRASGIAQGMGLTKEKPGFIDPSGVADIAKPTIKQLLLKAAGFSPMELILAYEAKNRERIMLDNRLNNENINFRLGQAIGLQDWIEVGRLLYNAKEKGIHIHEPSVINQVLITSSGMDFKQQNVPKDLRDDINKMYGEYVRGR